MTCLKPASGIYGGQARGGLTSKSSHTSASPRTRKGTSAREVAMFWWTQEESYSSIMLDRVPGTALLRGPFWWRWTGSNAVESKKPACSLEQLAASPEDHRTTVILDAGSIIL